MSDHQMLRCTGVLYRWWLQRSSRLIAQECNLQTTTDGWLEVERAERRADKESTQVIPTVLPSPDFSHLATALYILITTVTTSRQHCDQHPVAGRGSGGGAAPLSPPSNNAVFPRHALLPRFKLATFKSSTKNDRDGWVGHHFFPQAYHR